MHFIYKNTKTQKSKRESALPFFSFPLLLHLVIHTPNVQTAFYYVPFRHLGYIFGTFAHNVQPRCTDLASSFFCCQSIELGASQRVFIGVCCEPFLVLLVGQMLKFIRLRSSKHLLFLE